MDPVALVGTLAGVAAAVVAVLQLRRTPRERDARVPAVTTTAPVPVLLAPTGKFGELYGRQELLAELEECLIEPDGRFHVLAGLGGVGKTTVALALAERARELGCLVWWVSATDGASVTAALLGLAGELGAPLGEVEEARAGRRIAADVLWTRLERRTGWLLVLDNADDLHALQVAGAPVMEATGWLRPTQSGLVLVTSRVVDAGAWGRHGALHPLAPLSRDEGARLLVSLAAHGGTPDEAGALAGRLGGLPLALTHAGHHLSSPFSAEQTFTAYMTALDDRLPELLGEGSEDAVVTSTWEVSLDTLARQGQAQARPLLRVLSCFAPSVEIDTGWLDTRVLSKVSGGERKVRSGLEALLSMGLAETRTVPGWKRRGLVVHPLVAAASRLHASPEITRAAVGVVHRVVSGLREDEPSDWPVWQGLMPHLRALLCLAPAVIEEPVLDQLADVAVRGAAVLRGIGAYVAAVELGALALRQCDVLGARHRRVLALRHQRARSRVDLGDAVAAEAELREVIHLQEATLGPRHSDTLAVRHSVGHALFAQGRYEESRQEYESLLEVENDVLGADHPDSLATRHEIARALAACGLFTASERACKDVLAVRTRVLGPEHPDTLTTRFHWVRAIGELGHYAEAEAGYRDLLAVRTRVIGAEHPLTLRTRLNLMTNLASQGLFEEAEAGYSALLVQQVRILGPEHTDTLLCLSNRASTLTDLGRHAEAEESLRKALDVSIRVRGVDHVYTLDIRYELGRALLAKGEHRAAEDVLLAVLRDQTRVAGADNPHTIVTRHELARLMAKQGRTAEARAEYIIVVDSSLRAYGHDHPLTVVSRTELAALELLTE
ncbi:FxSxx-COOH system tetratricopeptide repeat protein [Nonomuraea muscovyensis]|uniref:Tetratricopeptide (TPR) repeat protein/DNA polymerase III delta prime subunit n=1 Tax=Nonomuraea muscovyensis TaxID=1124761 RepID=A0A7X0C9T5_9ACTN|nr:FxSxx-COOH system tetratricopeptide repeat protein [Nonomuraea muscovyensis]MBB6349349.1 tetratricopeptide (TPR) repeat protein/DNA polymerase III delta prime subunit [Nonomuraea muscovyensis]